MQLSDLKPKSADFGRLASKSELSRARLQNLTHRQQLSKLKKSIDGEQRGRFAYPSRGRCVADVVLHRDEAPVGLRRRTVINRLVPLEGTLKAPAVHTVSRLRDLKGTAMSIADQAKRVYESRFKAELEAKHRDRFVAIEPVSESFFLGDQFIAAALAPSRSFPIESRSSSASAMKLHFTSEGLRRDRESR